MTYFIQFHFDIKAYQDQCYWRISQLKIKHIMKNIIFTLALTILSTSLFAQIKKVDAVNASMTQGTNRGLKVLIPETSKKEVLKARSKLMKEYNSKSEKIKKEDEYLSPDAIIPSLGERPVNVYAQFQETPEGVYFTSFFAVDGAYLNTDMYKEQTESAIDLINTFANNTAKASISEKVKTETKKLEKLEKEQNGLVKDKEGYDKDIKDAKETIVNSEKAIKENDAAQVKKKKEVAEQKAVAEKVKAQMKKFD